MSNKPDTIPRDVIDAMAYEIGSALCDYIREMYPAAVEATASTFLTSVRNHVRNDIMDAAKNTTPETVENWIARRLKHRAKLAEIRRAATIAAKQRARNEAASRPTRAIKGDPV